VQDKEFVNLQENHPKDKDKDLFFDPSDSDVRKKVESAKIDPAPIYEDKDKESSSDSKDKESKSESENKSKDSKEKKEEFPIEQLVIEPPHTDQ